MHCNGQKLSHYIVFPFVLWLEARWFSFVLWLYFLHIIDLRQIALRQEIAFLGFCPVTYHSVQFSSVTQSCLTLCDPMNCSTPGLPVHHQLPEFTQTQSTESVMPSSHLILCRPLLFLPPIPPSLRVFSNESALRIRWPKYWSFSFSISPSNEYSGLISFRI